MDRRHAKAHEQFRRHRKALLAFMQESFAEIRKELVSEQQVSLVPFRPRWGNASVNGADTFTRHMSPDPNRP